MIIRHKFIPRAFWGEPLVESWDTVNLRPRHWTEDHEIVGGGGAVLEDDFMTGTTFDGTVGELGWSSLNFTVSYPAGAADHPGIVNLEAGALMLAGLFPYNADELPNMIWGDLQEATFIVRPKSTLASTIYRIGLGEDAGAEPAKGARFVVDPANESENWYVEVTDGDPVNIDTGIECVLNTWYRLQIVRVSSTQVAFYIDDELVYSAVADLPAANQVILPFVQIENLDEVLKSIEVDYIRVTTIALDR